MRLFQIKALPQGRFLKSLLYCSVGNFSFSIENTKLKHSMQHIGVKLLHGYNQLRVHIKFESLDFNYLSRLLAHVYEIHQLNP